MDNNSRLNLAAIIGPTGMGKSHIAVEVALRLDAEIISCDSMQVYRHMNIGTAKISPEETGDVAHHLLDVREPWEPFSVSDYQRMAGEAIRDINRRGKIPLLVGGTGLYYQAVVDSYNLVPSPASPETRAVLAREAEEKGNAVLHQRLQELDPKAAGRINPHDARRTIRALEVIELTGRPFSSLRKRNRGQYNLAVAGLIISREILYPRLDARVDTMIREGLVDEVRDLVSRGCRREDTSMQALGYAQILDYLDGFYSWEETVAAIKKETRRYSKRQLTWFRRDPRINWLDMAEHNQDEVIKKICNLIRRTMNRNVE